MLLAATAAKPKPLGDVLAIDRQARAGHRRRPQAQARWSAAAVGQSASVALEFLAIAQPIVGGQHRLGTLHVRVSRQDAILVVLGPADERALQVDQPRVDPVDRLADPKPQIGRDLVVAAAGSVQLAAHVAEPVDQCPLDVHVDVFQFDAELESSLLNFLADFARGLAQSAGIRRR